ncbi:unnamed protein product [Discosporangium mesarthrocarpum]
MPDGQCPIPGLRCLVVETVGRVHYLCFASRKTRDEWVSEVGRGVVAVGGPPEDSFTAAADMEMGLDPREEYALKSSKWCQPTRLILNSRRFGFDLPQRQPLVGGGTGLGPGQGGQTPVPPHGTAWDVRHPYHLASDALRVAFSITHTSGRDMLVSFLDLTCDLRRVDLGQLDPSSDKAFCFFANVYHLLARHSLLVLKPPPSAKDWVLYMSQVSYEIGGDVFSLQELEHCVLRGTLPRPSPKVTPKRFPALPSEDDGRHAYRLKMADPRISLVLNNGSLSNPPVMVLFEPQCLEEQIHIACQSYVEHTIKIDAKKRQVRVSPTLQMYAADVPCGQGEPKAMVRHVLRYAGHRVVQEMSLLDVDITQLSIRYHTYQFKCHKTMTLLDAPFPVKKGEESPSSQAVRGGRGG